MLGAMRPPTIIPPEVLDQIRAFLESGGGVREACRKFSTDDLKIYPVQLTRAFGRPAGELRKIPPKMPPGAELKVPPVPSPQALAIAEPPWLAKFKEALDVCGIPGIAAEFAGITHDEFEVWLRETASPESVADLRRIRGASTMRFVQTVVQAALRGDVNAAKWLLQNTRGDQFGPQATVHHVSHAADAKPTGAGMVSGMLAQLQAAGGLAPVLARDLNAPPVLEGELEPDE